eukprot:gene22733-biopygen5775
MRWHSDVIPQPSAERREGREQAAPQHRGRLLRVWMRSAPISVRNSTALETQRTDPGRMRTARYNPKKRTRTGRGRCRSSLGHRVGLHQSPRRATAMPLVHLLCLWPTETCPLRAPPDEAGRQLPRACARHTRHWCADRSYARNMQLPLALRCAAFRRGQPTHS